MKAIKKQSGGNLNAMDNHNPASNAAHAPLHDRHPKLTLMMYPTSLLEITDAIDEATAYAGGLHPTKFNYSRDNRHVCGPNHRTYLHRPTHSPHTPPCRFHRGPVQTITSAKDGGGNDAAYQVKKCRQTGLCTT